MDVAPPRSLMGELARWRHLKIKRVLLLHDAALVRRGGDWRRKAEERTKIQQITSMSTIGTIIRTPDENYCSD
jgi:hypothetical protein